MSRESRFLERFWSLYLINRIGVFRSIFGALLGALKILFILAALAFGFFILVHVLDEHHAQIIVSISIVVGIGVLITYFLIRVLVNLFR